jgi:NADH-quinone oxidoreductase subunit M
VLVILTTLLMPISVLSSWTAVTKRPLTYYALLLLLESAMIGVSFRSIYFSSTCFLKRRWFRCSFSSVSGVANGRIYAAVKFFIYTAVGSLLMLVGIIALYFIHQRATGSVLSITPINARRCATVAD